MKEEERSILFGARFWWGVMEMWKGEWEVEERKEKKDEDGGRVEREGKVG